MEIIVHDGIIATYQKHGNDNCGNSIYLVNFFKNSGKNWYDCNYSFGRKRDKYGNIRIKSYNIIQDIREMTGI